MSQQDGHGPTILTRRRFLGGAVVVLCSPPVLLTAGCTPAPSTPDGGTPREEPPTMIDGWPIHSGITLTAARYATLSALMDALIPSESGKPGAVELSAPWYLDSLLGAFKSDPPRIHAGGPYSGRHGGLDGFSHFQRLTRVEDIRWRTYIEGSRGIPEREFNGPVEGLVDVYARGLDAFDSAARDAYHVAFTALSLDERRSLLLSADAAFLRTCYEHTVEGCYGDPVYGGNVGGAAWRNIGYEGDRQPIGYTAAQMARPEDG